MSLLSRLERRFGRFAVSNVTQGLIVLQVFAYVWANVPAANGGKPLVGSDELALIGTKVLEGEIWRLVSFVAMPPLDNLLFALFAWYLFYLMGTALDHFWGSFRYNVYLLIAYLVSIGAAFILPEAPFGPAAIQTSVFLAFATLAPNFELYIFFVLPIRIKWLALLTWIGCALAVIVGDWATRLMVAVLLTNYFVFFGRDVLQRIRWGRRHMTSQVTSFKQRKPRHFHKCTVCGITDVSHPNMEFRYCSKCDGQHGYCSEHLHNHDHIPAGAENVNGEHG